MDNGEDLNLKYWTDASEGYRESIVKELGNYKRDYWYDLVIEHAPKKERLKILDVGTGPGFFTITFAREGHDIIGIDCTPDMLEKARINAKSEGVKAEFKLMNANKLDFPDDTFDLVISRNVTWTIPDMYDCYREWRRVLVPGGKVIVFDANWYLNRFNLGKDKIFREGLREYVREYGQLTHHSDFHVREPYWEDRPMIGTPRPEWDTNMLHKLRFWKIKSKKDIFKGTKMGEETTKTISITPTFMIVAEKPSPSDEDMWMTTEYWDGISPCVGVTASKMFDAGTTGRYADIISEFLPGSNSSHILDIGTGCGTVAISLAEKGYNVTGIDISKFMLEEAEIIASDRNVKLKLMCANASRLPFGKGKFDAVVCRNALWTFPDPEVVFKEVNRVLKPNGMFAYSDGQWLSKMKAWEEVNADSDLFPCEVKRDLGYGGTDIMDKVYSRLCLTDEARPTWDKNALKRCGFHDICVTKDFKDPMQSDLEIKVFGKGFLISSRKSTSVGDRI